MRGKRTATVLGPWRAPPKRLKSAEPGRLVHTWMESEDEDEDEATPTPPGSERPIGNHEQVTTRAAAGLESERTLTLTLTLTLTR